MLGLVKLVKFIRVAFKINWFKTLYLNLKTQKLAVALRLPIVVYGKVKVKSLQGNIIFDCPIKFGTLQIGRDIDYFSFSYLPSIISIFSGKVIVKGRVLISGGNTIICNGGTITLGKFVVLASGVNIRSYRNIVVGNYTRIASNCFVMDTNVHYLINKDSKIIRKIEDDIIIGKYCWLNSGTLVSKGSKIPDYSISSRNSYLNRDYTLEGTTGLLLVGSPAVSKGQNYQRIFSYSIEKRISNIFRGDLGLTEINLAQIGYDEAYVDNDMDFEQMFQVF